MMGKNKDEIMDLIENQDKMEEEKGWCYDKEGLGVIVIAMLAEEIKELGKAIMALALKGP